MAFFNAIEGSTGNELWKSDGTAAGTVLVKDIASGVGNSFPSSLTNVNGTLFFSANDGTTGRELWKSDSTTIGTIRVKDILTGPLGSNPRNLVNVNGTLFFGANGDEIWKSDGTAAGTVRVKDINTSSSTSAFGYGDFTNISGTLFFSANDGTSGLELWKSDGTENGTVRVKDIHPSGSGLLPFLTTFTNVNGTLFFRADDGTSGVELWKSDGTDAGTVRVKDIRPGSESSQLIPDMENLNGTLYFSADDGANGVELWKSDGTETGTARVKDIRPGIESSLRIPDLTNVNGTLFFRADDGTTGLELWKSDGTTVGTVLVSDLTLGTGTGFNTGNNTDRFTNVNGTLYFRHTEISTGRELWKSDGTSAGTTLVADLRPGSDASGFGYSSMPEGLTNVNGTLFFRATDDGTTFSVWALRPQLSVPSLAIAATSANKSEGNSGSTLFTFTVTRSGSLTGATTVNYAVTSVGASPATANDFVGNVLPSGSVTFAAGQATRVITIPVRGDTTVESNETFRVTLSSASGGATITTAVANGVIRNDDTALPTTLAIAATSANKNEGNSGSTPFTFTVTRSGNISGATTVNYAVTGVGASPATANDFVLNAFPSGTVTFAAGQATRVITIPVRGDTTVESNETFRVTLSGASGGATITTAAANGVIRNDDTSLAIAPTSANKNEGNSGAIDFTFTVTRSGLLTRTTTVDYAVTGIGANPASANDFIGNVLPTGTVTFAPGETTKVISIPVRGDVTVEANEGFRVRLLNPSLGASITTAVASGLIRNDDL